jgi:hypothetical protein
VIVQVVPAEQFGVGFAETAIAEGAEIAESADAKNESEIAIRKVRFIGSSLRA